MDITPCTIDSVSGCITCPAIAPIPATPPTTTSTASPAWDSGANSIAMLDGDLHTTFSVDKIPTGIAIGFKDSRAFAASPERISYAFRLYAVGTATVVEVWEGNARRTAPKTYTLGSTIEIRRVAGMVTFLLDSALVYQSATPSHGPLVVNACLFSAGDAVT